MGLKELLGNYPITRFVETRGFQEFIAPEKAAHGRAQDIAGKKLARLSAQVQEFKARYGIDRHPYCDSKDELEEVAEQLRWKASHRDWPEKQAALATQYRVLKTNAALKELRAALLDVEIVIGEQQTHYYTYTCDCAYGDCDTGYDKWTETHQANCATQTLYFRPERLTDTYARAQQGLLGLSVHAAIGPDLQTSIAYVSLFQSNQRYWDLLSPLRRDGHLHTYAWQLPTRGDDEKGLYHNFKFGDFAIGEEYFLLPTATPADAFLDGALLEPLGTGAPYEEVNELLKTMQDLTNAQSLQWVKGKDSKIER